METDLLETRMLRDGARRHIAFEALESVTDARVRESVGREWLGRMRQEHLAVGAFARLAFDLAADGCEPIVLSLVARAGADEVRHAEVCRRLAISMLGEKSVPRSYFGVPRIPEHPGVSPSARVLFHMVEMCCLSETVTGVYFTESLALTTHPTMRIAIESLLEDEIDHGRVGWAYLASRARDERIEGLASALPDMVDRVFGRLATKTRREPAPDHPDCEMLGSPGNETTTRIFKHALREVVLPGFEMLHVDLGPTRERIALRGFLD